MAIVSHDYGVGKRSKTGRHGFSVSVSFFSGWTDGGWTWRWSTHLTADDLKPWKAMIPFKKKKIIKATFFCRSVERIPGSLSIPS